MPVTNIILFIFINKWLDWLRLAVVEAMPSLAQRPNNRGGVYFLFCHPLGYPTPRITFFHARYFLEKVTFEVFKNLIIKRNDLYLKWLWWSHPRFVGKKSVFIPRKIRRHKIENHTAHLYAEPQYRQTAYTLKPSFWAFLSALTKSSTSRSISPIQRNKLARSAKRRGVGA